MKNIICVFIISIFITTITTAQIEKTLENSYPLPGSKRVSLDLKFARDIKVSISGSNEVKLITRIRATNEEIAKKHILKANENADLLLIETTYQFDKNNQCWNCDNDGKNWSGDKCLCLEARYELVLPEDALLSLKTISGDIEITGLPTEIQAKSISGFVDLTLPTNAKANLNFKSVTGEIYSDFEVKLDGKSTSYSKRLNAPLNGGGNRVALETVSGDIFFRKAK